MRLTLSVACLLAGTVAAAASGGLSCSVEGPTAVDINAGVTRGMGSPVFSLTGTMTLTDTDVAEDLRQVDFGKEHLAQYWLDGEDLRLLLYRERAAEKEFGYVELEIRAQRAPDDESVYAGKFSLDVSDMTGGGEGKNKSFDGEISCSVE